MRKNEEWSFGLLRIEWGWHETLNLPFMYVVAQCLHFVMPYVKQNKNRTQTLESALYELETIFTWQTLNYNDLNTIAAKNC